MSNSHDDTLPTNTDIRKRFKPNSFGLTTQNAPKSESSLDSGNLDFPPTPNQDDEAQLQPNNTHESTSSQRETESSELIQTDLNSIIPPLRIHSLCPHFFYLIRKLETLSNEGGKDSSYPSTEIDHHQLILIRSLNYIFSNPTFLGQAFLLETHHRRQSLDSQGSQNKNNQNPTSSLKPTPSDANIKQENAPSSPSPSPSSSHLIPSSPSKKRKNRHKTISLNFGELYSFSNQLLKFFQNKSIGARPCRSFIYSCSKLISQLSAGDSTSLLCAAPGRIVIILFFFAQLFKHEYCYPSFTIPFLTFIHNLPSKMKTRIQLALLQFPKLVLSQLLNLTQNIIDSSISSYSSPQAFFQKNSLHFALDFMRSLFRISLTVKFASYTMFYNQTLNDRLPLNLEFHYWYNSNKSLFSFLRFFPFVLNPFTKYSILQGEHYFIQVSLKNRRSNNNALQQFFGSQSASQQDPIYCILRVRRSHLIQDSLSQLQSIHQESLKLPLKIQFIDEPGVDQGGLRQEFFRLLIHQFFDTSYSMFQLHDESSLFWFYPYTFESPIIYQLFGFIVGLALYNSTPLDLHFPLYLFRLMVTPTTNLLPDVNSTLKSPSPENSAPPSVALLSPRSSSDPSSRLSMSLFTEEEGDITTTDDVTTEPEDTAFSQTKNPSISFQVLPKPTLAEFSELFPTTARSFEKLRQLDPSLVESTLCSNFTITLDCYGKKNVHPLIPGGENIPVNGENLDSFIQYYISHRFIHSVEYPLRAFLSGFKRVVSSSILHNTLPKELRIMIIGERQLDFQSLQTHTQYVGYTPNDPIIINFWHIVLSMTPHQQRKLLAFVTGNDRAPPGGLEKLPFKIQKNGDIGSLHLPTSHACFNTLLLPPYPTKTILASNLSIALDNCNGFGLI